MKKLRSMLVIGAMLIAMAVGCAKRPNVPIYSDPDLENMGFDTVTFLPVVDRRVDKSYDIDLEKDVGGRVVKDLEKKGYTVLRADAFSQSANVPNNEVAEMEAHELAELGPDNAERMLVVYLDDVSSKTALGYSFKMESTAVLVDKSSGSMLWKDKGIGSAGQGGMLGCAMAGATKGEAMGLSVKEMMGSFPKTPAKRKS
jgi:hypothetical protein